MMKTSTIRSYAFLAFAAAAIIFVCGQSAEVKAQRDPFKKAGWETPKKQGQPGAVKSGTGTVAKGGVPGGATVPVSYAPPAVESRIEYYKKVRDAAAMSGAPIPKVTSVLTLSELAVTGIFKTPRGYAAMVEATPIKLSYTIYPGEKFFDGQLVAVEENRLVFKKVTKVGEGKFVASVENKTLRQFTMKSQAEGTAPVQDGKGDKPVEVASNQAPPAKSQPAPVTEQPAVPQPVSETPTKASKNAKPAGNPFLSPLDEMNNLPPSTQKDDKAKKPAAKKPTKVAKNDESKQGQ